MRWAQCVVGAAVLTMLAGTAGCVTEKRDTSESVPVLRNELYLRRTGGMAGTDDQIWVLPDRHMRTTGKLVGKNEGTIAEHRYDEMVALVQQWDKLVPKGDPSAPGVDHFEYVLTYGESSIAWSAGAKNIPENLTKLTTIILNSAASLQNTQGEGRGAGR